jgi:hypothetical protein
MLFYIVKWSILYFILILLMHNLYLYFKKNLTSTKTKDFFNYPNVEYDKIYSIINKNNAISEKQHIDAKPPITINNDHIPNDISKEFNIENFNNIFEKNANVATYGENDTGDPGIIGGIGGSSDPGVTSGTGGDMKNELNDFLNNLNKND